MSYSEEVARLRQTQHLAVWRVAPGSAPGGGTAPAVLTPPLSMQCSGCCSPLALSAVVTQVPSWPNLCFKMKYVWKTSPSFENISITFQQSSPCSDSSWASFSALPIPPQLIFRLVVVNIFFFYLVSYSGEYLFPFYLFSFTIFSLLPPPKHKLKKHSIFAVVVNWCALAFCMATSLSTPG